MIVKVVLCTAPRTAVHNLGAINVYCYCDFQVDGIEMLRKAVILSPFFIQGCGCF